MTRKKQRELAARWRTRRCRCGAPAVAVTVGRNGVSKAGILLVTPRVDRNRCAAHMLVSPRRAGAVA